MSKLKINLMFLGLLVLISCHNSSVTNKQWKNEYIKLFKSYPTELASHFPTKESIKPTYSSFVTYSSISSPPQILIEQKESDKTIDSLISISKRIKYSAKSFYIVNKYLRDKNTLSIPYHHSQYKVQIFIPNAVPIPNFYEVEDFDENTYVYLKRSYSIYIVESEPKKCCSDKQHIGKWFMPNEWKDGYSRGYAINRQTNNVIYWLVVW